MGKDQGVESPVYRLTSNPLVRGFPSGPVPNFIWTSDSMYRGFSVGRAAAQTGSVAVTNVDAVAVKVAAFKNCALELCDEIDMLLLNPRFPLRSCHINRIEGKASLIVSFGANKEPGIANNEKLQNGASIKLIVG